MCMITRRNGWSPKEADLDPRLFASPSHHAEVADRDLRAQERQDKKLRAAIPECVLEEDEEVQVPATPE